MIAPLIQPFQTVILANGLFPSHPIARSFLHKADLLVCCDGAAQTLYSYGIEPHYIVGDLDSLSPEMRQRYSNCLYYNPDQDTNDLTKSVQFCLSLGKFDITILGATGLREDHSIANIALLADYAAQANLQMITDFGVFIPMLSSKLKVQDLKFRMSFESYDRQQVSIFSLTPDTIYTTYGLKFPLVEKQLISWWQGTLNEACNEEFSIEMNDGKALVFREHRKGI